MTMSIISEYFSENVYFGYEKQYQQIWEAHYKG